MRAQREDNENGVFVGKREVTGTRVRNRRYKRMLELREEGFFSEDSIKLRHPLLYHNYLGEHSQRSTAVGSADCTLSQFLEKNLINVAYRQKLAQELDQEIVAEKEKAEEEENWQVLEEVNGEMAMGKEGIRGEIAHSWEVVEEQEIEMQEDNLVDHAQELFLQGKVDGAFVNYSEIDNNSDYDELRQENLELQERYFQGEGDEAEDQRINQEYYSGVQDY